MTASSPRRRIRIVAGSALVAGLLASSACSAGQVTQTSRQVAPVPGINATVGPAGGAASIFVRSLVVVYNGPQGYKAGADVPLSVRLFNQTNEPVYLTGVTAEGAQAVLLAGGPKGTPSPTPPAENEPADVTASPTATPSPTAVPPAGEANFRVRVPAAGYVELVPGQDQHLILSKFTQPDAQDSPAGNAFVPGESVKTTFTFSDGATLTALVPFDMPLAALTRSPMDIAPEH
ncbi:hypothetical protein [Luedemannella helvata]|uniref:Uncharacterized protein n=1 Tax=Luedemannella helvata TaxID=349315 RepID=A0ABN2KEN6_9ACTN